MKTDWKIGDVAWIAGTTPTKVQKPCPVCFGQRRVSVILGDASVVAIDCSHCETFDRPRGYVEEWAYEPKAVRVLIASVTAVDGVVTDVRSSESDCVGADRLRETEEEALGESQAAEMERRDRDDQYALTRKNGSLRRASWLVGYHRSTAKRCREQAEYHEQRAAVLKSREVKP